MKLPKKGDLLQLLSLSDSRNINDFNISVFRTIQIKKCQNCEDEYILYLKDCENGSIGDFITKGFDEEGIELNRTNILFVLNPTQEKIEKTKKFIYAKTAFFHNHLKRK